MEFLLNSLGAAPSIVITYFVPFIIILSILVFIHEWGHYFVARRAGVKVDVFSIGFGRELFGWTDKSGTRWKFSLVPLGGYVKMFGDVDPASAQHSEEVEDSTGAMRPLTEEELKYAFYAQPVYKRAAVVFAGPAINYLFAIILLAGLYMFVGQPATPPVAGAIVAGSAAEDAGFLPYDEVLAIDGQRIERFEDLRREVSVALDREQIFTIMRDGEEMTLIATPAKISEDSDSAGRFKQTRGLLGMVSVGSGLRLSDIKAVNGIETPTAEESRTLMLENMDQIVRVQLDRGERYDEMIIRPISEQNESFLSGDAETTPEAEIIILSRGEEITFAKYGLLESMTEAVRESYSITVNTLEALGQMITGTRSVRELGGVIRIGVYAGEMAQAGLIALITFTALLSINLGLINLFPIPMLDGGHLVFYAVEAVKGSPVSEQLQEYAFRVGLVVLVGIMLFANLNDLLLLVFPEA